MRRLRAPAKGDLVKAFPDRLPIVGREREIEVLTKHLDDALAGKGSCVFISGEAGVGKTRLAEEMKEIARAKGFTVLSSHCLQEDFTVYGPFREALKTGGMEYLFAEGAPRVDSVHLVTDSGLLAKAVTREKNGLDPDLFASMLATVSRFLKDSLEPSAEALQPDSLRRLDYGDRSILVEKGDGVNLVTVLTGRENEFLVEDMRDAVDKVRSSYGQVLKAWDGDEERLEGIDSLLQPILAKYDGVDYTKQEPNGRRNLLFENVARGFVRRAGTRPIFLCIEDLQWADPSTLALMHYVTRNARDCGLVVLGSFRPEDLVTDGGGGHNLLNAMSKMEKEGLLVRSELQRLSQNGTARLLCSLLAGDIGEETAAQIYQESAGNPLFTIEMTRWLAEEEVLAHDGQSWKLPRELRPEDVPTQVRDVLARRLGRLEEDRRAIVDIASVIGEEFDTDLLAAAARIDRFMLMRILGVLEDRHRLLRRDDGRYRFDHVKIKEVLYHDLPGALRQEYHGTVAASLEALHGGDIGAVAGEVGFHFLRSKEPGRALPHLIRAAEQAAKQYANAEAIRFYSQALELEMGPMEKFSILHSLSRLHEIVGSFDMGIESLQRALPLSSTSEERARTFNRLGWLLSRQMRYDDTEEAHKEALKSVEGRGSCEEAEALRALGVLYFERHKDREMAMDCYRKSVRILEGLGDNPGLARVLNNLGKLYINNGENDKAEEALSRSITLQASNPLRMTIPLENLGRLYRQLGDYTRAFECLERSRLIREQYGDQPRLAMLLQGFGILYYDLGDYDEALAYHSRSMKLCQRLGMQHYLAFSHHEIGLTYAAKGLYDKALEHLRAKHEILKSQGLEEEAPLLCVMGQVYGALGEFNKAIDYLGRSIRASERIGDRGGMVCHLSALGHVVMDTGDYEKAREHFIASLREGESLGERHGIAAALLGLAELCVRSGRVEEASESLARGSRFAKEIGARELVAYGWLVSGLIHSVRHDWQQASHDFEESVRAHESMGRLHDLGKAHYECALMWKEKGDLFKMGEHLDTAIELFKTLNLENDLAKAKKVRDACGGIPASEAARVR